MDSTSEKKDIIIFISNQFLTIETQDLVSGLVDNMAEGKAITIYYFDIKQEGNRCIEKWKNNDMYKLHIITSEFEPPTLTEDTIVVDALFGFELKAPLSGGFSAVIQLINASKATVFSIGAPSGLMPVDNSSSDRSAIIKANYTLLLQEPPLSYYFIENQVYFGEVLAKYNIGQSYHIPAFTHIDEIKFCYKPRKRFSHKGTYGKGLLIAGSMGMAGAAHFSAQGALKSGIGLLHLHCPFLNREIHQNCIPEAILSVDQNEFCFSHIDDFEEFDAIAIGPGLGTYTFTEVALESFLTKRANIKSPAPLVIDADALNLIADKTEFLESDKYLKNTILTPHPIEMERLVGHCNNSYELLQKGIQLSVTTGAYIILKGPYSFLISPSGHFKMNPTGTSGMATGGSGDILTGILLGLVTQGYSLRDAMALGTYIHGKAGELAATEIGDLSMVASDIINYLPKAWKEFVEQIDE